MVFEEKCFQLTFDSSANNTPLKNPELHIVMHGLIVSFHYVIDLHV